MPCARLDESSAELMKTITPISADLLHSIISHVDDWLRARGMRVFVDDPNREPVTTSGATVDGLGHVSVNFYFKTQNVE
jgi:hypothetical protein